MKYSIYLILNIFIVYYCICFVSADTDYCLLQNKDCELHIGCADNFVHTMQRNSIFEYQTNVPLTSEIRERLLDIYNRFKNDIATAKVGIIPSAANLTAIVWDDELEKVATIASDILPYDNLGDEFCFNTEKSSDTLFKSSNHGTKTQSKVMDELDHIFNNKHARLRFGPSSFYFFSHITKLACRAVYHPDPDSEDTHFAYRCIYSFELNAGIPKGKSPPYVVGRPCSMCVNGCHPIYPGLCIA